MRGAPGRVACSSRGYAASNDLASRGGPEMHVFSSLRFVTLVKNLPLAMQDSPSLSNAWTTVTSYYVNVPGHTPIWNPLFFRTFGRVQVVLGCIEAGIVQMNIHGTSLFFSRSTRFPQSHETQTCTFRQPVRYVFLNGRAHRGSRRSRSRGRHRGRLDLNS